MGFGLVTGFTACLQLKITSNYKAAQISVCLLQPPQVIGWLQPFALKAQKLHSLTTISKSKPKFYYD
jgi:hypothetical protein